MRNKVIVIRLTEQELSLINKACVKHIAKTNHMMSKSEFIRAIIMAEIGDKP